MPADNEAKEDIWVLSLAGLIPLVINHTPHDTI